MLVVALFVYFRSMGASASMWSKMFKHTKRWEGGLSNNINDYNSANPSPYTHDGQTNWHTNKGISWQTFQYYAERLGIDISKQNFINMSDSIFRKILKEGVGEVYDIKKLTSYPSIQAVLVSWSWGYGSSGSERHLANFQREYYGINDDNITKEEIVNNFKSRLTIYNRKDTFKALCDYKRRIIMNSTQSANKQGWLNRLDDFYLTFKD